MRFLETLLLVLVAIYVAQLVITSMILAALLLFLWCLWKRPREALVLGLGVLLVAFISKPIGLTLVFMIALGFGLWALARGFGNGESPGLPLRPAADPAGSRGGENLEIWDLSPLGHASTIPIVEMPPPCASADQPI